MPHLASPSQLFDLERRTRTRQLRARGVVVTCDGAEHRLALGAAFQLEPLDHDGQAEDVLVAMGGPPPTCVRAARALASAEPADLWDALTRPAAAGDDRPLRALSDGDLRTFLAIALADEFAGAGRAVRDSVAQLGLALLGTDDGRVELLAAKYRMTREFPRWDTGPGPWSDQELVLLSHYLRGSPGDVPHLELLPSDAVARRVVARYAAGRLDDARVHSAADLRALLAPTFRNVRALTSLMVSEGLLEHDNGRYRVRGGTRRRRPTR